MSLHNVRLGYAMTGSFCTFEQTFEQLEKIVALGAHVTPILSYSVRDFDTRFGSAEQTRSRLEALCHAPIIDTIPTAEPIGPKDLFDLIVVAPCTGNTMAKIANAITDTPVTMACKAHLRNLKPVLLAVSTNDALSGNARNLGTILNMKNITLTPLYQDSPLGKPNSLVANYELLIDSIHAALDGRQLQPLFCAP